MAYKLFFKFESATRVYLSGTGISAPVKGARYSPGLGVREVEALGREVISETITVELAGTYAEITNWITALGVEIELWKAGAWRKPGWLFPVVCIEPDTTVYWASELLDVNLSLDPGGMAQRELGSQLVTIKIKRLDRWKYSSISEPDIIMGDDEATQLDIGHLLNHYDATAEHTNWGYVPATDAALALGAMPADCSFTLSTAQAGRSLGDIYVGCSWSDDTDPWYYKGLPTLQETEFTAGAGVTKTSVASALSAGGNYATFDWAAAGEVEIGHSAVPTDLYDRDTGNGRPFKAYDPASGGSGGF